ncbi:MAG: DUF4340 domain-containing protein [Clostridia bacterium]|nr:DUF4340 domain-containing protein [Clostridia bacterium]
MIKKQKALIITCAVVIAALAVAYFIWVHPLLNKMVEIILEPTIGEECYNIGSDYIRVEEDKNGKQVWTNLYTGKECVAPDGASESSFSHLMFPTIELENIYDLTVHNQYGEFSMYYYNSSNPEESTVYMRGYEETPIISDYSYLMVAARHPVVYSRMTEDLSNLKDYGLDEESVSAWYEITEVGGRKYKVLIGNLAPTGDRYYVMVEGQKAIYIADTEINYLLRSKESYVLPVLSMPTDENEYYKTERFTLKKDGEIFVDIDFLTESERAQLGTSSYYKMQEPGDYPVNSTNYDDILKKFTGFQGTQTVAFGSTEDVMDKAILEEYGLNDPKYCIYYNYAGIDNDIYVSDLITNEETGESCYYAYSLFFNIVAKVDPSTVDFVNWDFLKFVDRPVLAHTNINSIASISVSGSGVDETFELNGTDDNLSVLCKSTGKAYSGDGTMNFRLFYKKMLEIALQDYSQNKTADNMIMTLTVTTKAGEKKEYVFYAESAGHCYYTVNGDGEFYVLRDRVERILADAVVLASGGEIDSEAT